MPFIHSDYVYRYNVNTAASSGSVTTHYFGEQFDAAKVETGPLQYTVYVYTPASVRNNANVTLHIEVEKVSLGYLSSGGDRLRVGDTPLFDTHRTFNFTPPTHDYYYIQLSREVLPADVRKQKLDMMPGYRVSWHYSSTEVEPEAKYYNDTSTRAFVRNHFNNITFSVSLKFQ